MALSQEHIDNILSRKRRPSSPGSVLLDIIEDNDDFTFESFAQNLDITIDHLKNIIKGTVQIDYKLAEYLGNVLGNGPESWLNLQESVNIWDKHNAVKPSDKVILKTGQTVTIKDVKSNHFDNSKRVYLTEEAILVNGYEHVDEANIKGLLNEEPIASVNGEFKTWSVN